METKVKKREWVKDAAIIFLAVLLVLTFFSNTIMNRSLPEVATAAVTEGSIVSKVRGSGTVTANGKQQVKAKETRTIRAVMIKTGQEVNAGDVLFVLGEGDETALEAAKETLRNLQYSYQRSAVSLPSFDSFKAEACGFEGPLKERQKPLMPTGLRMTEWVRATRSASSGNKKSGIGSGSAAVPKMSDIISMIRSGNTDSGLPHTDRTMLPISLHSALLVQDR